MKKLLLLFLLALGGVGTVKATDYYIAGNFNSWGVSVKMTPNGDGTYSHSFPATTDVYFAFSEYSNSSDGSNVNNWNAFNSKRISPTDNSGNQTISTFNEFVNLNVGGGSNASYCFTPGHKYYNATYTITLNPSDKKVKISVTSVNSCSVYVIGEVNNQAWDSNVGTELTGSNGVYTGTITLSGDNKTFSFSTKLAGSWDDMNSYQFKGSDNFNMVGDIIISTSNINYPAGTYDLKVDLNNETISATIVSGYKYLTSSDGVAWTDGGNFSGPSEGVYTANIPSMKGNYLVIIPNITSLSGTTLSNWKYAIRPTAATSEFTIYFQNYNSSTVNNTNSGSAALWRLDDDNDAATTINYTPATGAYTLDLTRTTSIGGAGYITWSNGEKYMVEGATAYTVTDMGNYARLNAQEAGIVYPAGTGLVLGGSGSVTIKAVASDASTEDYASSVALNVNDLVGNGNSSENIAAGSYVLYWDGTNASSVGFKKAIAGTLGAHKAYLPAGGSAREFLGFDEEVTGINEVGTTMSEGIIYNLQGVRVNKMQKGLNVVNGKKVMVK